MRKPTLATAVAHVFAALLTVGGFVPQSASAAPTESFMAVDQLVSAHIERHGIPGVAIAITRDGTLVHARGFGLANVELQVPVRPETVFQSGSVGKQFTAMAVMMLVEEGRLGLDDPIGRHLPDAPEAWRDITVRHLLTHTSGIKDWEGGTDIDYRRDYSEDELAKVAMSLPMDFPPGAKWSYSNTAYVMLGVLVRRISGQFYGDFLAERVFKPLGMNATRVISEADIVPNRSSGYTRASGRLQHQEWVAPTINTTADGSLYTTVLDLAKWDAALRARRFLTPEGYRAMWSPVRLRDGTTYPYGFGWSFDVQRRDAVIGHTGSWQGFKSAIVRYPQRRLSVIVLANLAEAEPMRLATSIAGLVEPALAWPEVTGASAVLEPARTVELRDALRSWAAGAEPPRLTQGLRDAVAPEDRKDLREQLESASGFQLLAEDDVGDLGLERHGAAIARVGHYLVRGAPDRRLRLFMTPEGQIADFAAEAVD